MSNELQTTLDIFNLTYRTFGTQLRAPGPNWQYIDEARPDQNGRKENLIRWMGSPIGVSIFPAKSRAKELEFHIWFGWAESGLARYATYAKDILRELRHEFPGCVNTMMEPEREGRGIYLDVRIPYEAILATDGLEERTGTLAVLNAQFFDRMLRVIYPVVISKFND